jgi:hypothetical protein
MLVRCLYASRAAVPIVPSVVDSILEQSRRNNPRRGITGMLCYTNDLFVQVLEGGRNEVCGLFGAIVRDDRHRDVQILVFEEIPERLFGSWTMGRAEVGRANQGLLLKYSEKAELDPFVCPGRATMALLNELVAAGCVSSQRIN